MEDIMKIASYIYFNNNAPSDLTQLWAKPEGNNEYSLNIYTNGAWRPLIGNGGKSAYEIAVDNGFSGSVEEWLLSLKGAQGIVGPQGEQGIEGEQGPQGEAGVGIVDISYSSETSTNTTYIMTFSDGSTFAFSIPKGAQGPKGDTGATGATGEQGPKGDKGDTGAAGTNGTNGINGEDAYQPFKGWFDSSSDLENTLNSPEVGDYAYVMGATASDPIAIYHCTTAGTWTDSGHEFNPANNQEFLSGESLNTVRIIDDLTTGGATNVLSAKQGKALKADLDQLGPKIDELITTIYPIVIDSWIENKGIVAATGAVESVAGNHVQCSDFIDISGYDSLAVDLLQSSSKYGFALYDNNKAYLSGMAGAGTEYLYSSISINRNGATYIRITSANPDTHTECGIATLKGGIKEAKIILPSDVKDSLNVAEKGYALDARQGKVLLDLIKGVDTTRDVTDSITWSDGVVYKSGEFEDTNPPILKEIFHYSNYIDVEGYTEILSKWSTSSNHIGNYQVGSAFFDKNYNYISGNAYPQNSHGYIEATISIPSNAKYFVQTAYKDISTYGDTKVVLILSNKFRNVEYKEANPYFETFDSFNSNASTELVKEEIFSTTIGGGGGVARRIPAVVVTNSSAVLAATEIRASLDDNAQTGIVLARKTSGSSSWEYNVVLPYNAATYGKVMNPSFVVDRTGAHGAVGRVFLFFLAIQITSGNKGYARDCTTSEIDNMYIYSDDNGATWSTPISTKSAWDTTKWTWIGVSPANGCQLTNGTLCIPCMGRFSNQWFSGVAYLVVGGSWVFSGRTFHYEDNESTCFEGADANTLYLNCRNEGNGHIRNLYIYDFTKDSFEQIEYSGYDPNVICQQSISKAVVNGNPIFLQSSNDPSAYNVRDRLTLWVSKNGIVWQRMIRVNDATTYGYSVVDSYNGKMVIVYENEGTISFIDLTPLIADVIKTYNYSLGCSEEERMQGFFERFCLSL